MIASLARRREASMMDEDVILPPQMRMSRGRFIGSSTVLGDEAMGARNGSAQ